VYTVAKLAHRRIRLIHLPHRPAITLLQILERCGLRLPVKAEQIQRLNEHKAFASTEAEKDFGFAPRDFQTGVVAEVFEMSKMRIK
jgi:hypothetical protein